MMMAGNKVLHTTLDGEHSAAMGLLLNFAMMLMKVCLHLEATADVLLESDSPAEAGQLCPGCPYRICHENISLFI